MSQIRHMFVYGTFRPGHMRWPIIDHLGGVSIGTETIPGKLVTVQHQYPCLIPADDTQVEGNIIYFPNADMDDVLEDIDRIEGHPHLFQRRSMQVGGYDCWVYFWRTGNGYSTEPLMPDDDNVYRWFGG